MNIPKDDEARWRREAQERREIGRRADFKAVVETAEGRRFLRRLLAECGVHRTSFHTDALLMARAEGRREVGLWLQSLFADFPDQYLRLLAEERHEE